MKKILKIVLIMIMLGWQTTIIHSSNKIKITNKKNDKVILKKHIESYSLGYFIKYIPDVKIRNFTHLLKLENEKKINWQQSQKSSINLGYNDHGFWFRIDFDTSQIKVSQPYVFEVSYPPLDLIDFYQPSNKKSNYIKSQSGDQVSLIKRDFIHRNFAFNISLLPNKKRISYYFYIKTASSNQFPITLWKSQEFINNMTKESYVFGVFYGIMFIMILYNLFLYLSIRDKSYLYYVIYISVFVIFQFTLNGFSIIYLWPNQLEWNGMVLAPLVALATFFVILFSQAFLSLKTHSPKLNFISNIFLGVYALDFIFGFFLPYRIAIQSAMVLALPGVFLTIYSGIKSWKLGYTPARYFLLAWAGMLLGTFLILMKSLSLMPANFITNYGQQIGSVLEVLLLSLGLGDRINEIKKEKDAMQKDMIESISITNKAYSRFVPMEFLQFLKKKSIVDVSLGDQVQHEFSIMFIDIRSFTNLSETMTPRENFDFLNSYLKRISPVIKQHGGFIDKYIGDAVMALFPKEPKKVLEAAISIRKILISYNQHRIENNYDPIDIGIGIHSGSLILGTIGYQDRMEGTVISDAVNLASRLEGLTKQFQCGVIFSEAIESSIVDSQKEEICYRHLGKVKIKGKAKNISVYELYNTDELESVEKKNTSKIDFENAIALFGKSRFEEAKKIFKKIRQDNHFDEPAKVYLDRIEALQIEI